MQFMVFVVVTKSGKSNSSNHTEIYQAFKTLQNFLPLPLFFAKDAICQPLNCTCGISLNFTKGYASPFPLLGRINCFFHCAYIRHRHISDILLIPFHLNYLCPWGFLCYSVSCMKVSIIFCFWVYKTEHHVWISIKQINTAVECFCINNFQGRNDWWHAHQISNDSELGKENEVVENLSIC